MTRRARTPSTVADLAGGELVKLDLGMVRVTHRTYGRERWARLVGEDGRETDQHVWLKPGWRVVEVLGEPERGEVQAGEVVDPVMGGGR